MVQGVTPAHKELAPSRLINYFSVIKKMPMLGTHTVYKLWLGLSYVENPADFPKPVFIWRGSCRHTPQLIYINVVQHLAKKLKLTELKCIIISFISFTVTTTELKNGKKLKFHSYQRY
jgi:hypothetical protein